MSIPNSHTATAVAVLPPCDVCRLGCPACGSYPVSVPATARFDAKTIHRPWANLCPDHFADHGIGLGLGVGQVLLTDGDRYARVYGGSPATVARYLPSNYDMIGADGDAVLICGRDSAGWTMDDYVIPRLASGLIHATEVTDARPSA